MDAQMYVQLERTGSFKTIRYSQGDMLTFKLRNDDKGWYERTIISMDIPGRQILFADVTIHVDSIEAIRLRKEAKGAQLIGTALQGGGIQMILFTGYSSIFLDRGLDWTAMISGVLNIALGTAVKKVFRGGVFKVNSRKRIRLLDLNFSEPGMNGS